ncbi:MAG: hypothetical protein RLZZ401_1272, partial [Pseudomonadota bacterium]
ARFVAWRVTWDHILSCRQGAQRGPGLAYNELPSVIWTPECVLHRLASERCIGICSTDPQRRTRLAVLLDDCVKQSSPGFPASVLGL